MRRSGLTGIMLTALASLGGGQVVHADLLIADSQQDFEHADHPAQGHPDTQGTGSWYYVHARFAGLGWFPGSQTARLLDWLPECGGYSVNGRNCFITNLRLVPTASIEGFSPFTVREWKSNVTGWIRITAEFDHTGAEGDGIDFFIHQDYPGPGIEQAVYIHLSPGGAASINPFLRYVRPGESITFTAGPYDNRHDDHGRMKAWIEYVCAADTTDDGIVNVQDMLVVLGHWGVEGESPGDVDGNGVVDLEDLMLVLADWGSCL